MNEIMRTEKHALETPIAAIPNDPALLELMQSDSDAQQDRLYQPGPYWAWRSKRNVKEIKRLGLSDFRGAGSLIGQSFTDHVYLDARTNLTHGIRKPLRFLFESVIPFRNVFELQMTVTKSQWNEVRRLRNLWFNRCPVVGELLAKYTMPPSLAGGCLDYIEIGGERISRHYLLLLHEHDRVAQAVDFSGLRSVFEIGGGFGVNIHLLLENYPSIRKIVYLDISPNLYIGTQYLRSIYPEAIKDYRDTRSADRIQFSADDRREILAIAPWQIEKLDLHVDLFYNASSFVEMPDFVVSNYADHIANLESFHSTTVGMISYNHFRPGSELDPRLLPKYFPSKTFSDFTFQRIDESQEIIAFIGR